MMSGQTPQGKMLALELGHSARWGRWREIEKITWCIEAAAGGPST
jgi:hypothetical protein